MPGLPWPADCAPRTAALQAVRRISFMPGAPVPRFLHLLTTFLLALASIVGSSAHAQEGEVEYGHLVVITNFDNTEVSINGVSYPYEWIWGQSQGVLLPADRAYEIVVATSPTNRRTYRFRLEEGETRVLVADVENFGSAAAVPVAAPPPTPTPQAPAVEAAEEEEEEEAVGYLGVSSTPRGIVHVDGSDTGQRTPARRIELSPGRHEVTVFYDEEGVMSEVKHVLIRAGVNTNVFFRMARDRPAE